MDGSLPESWEGCSVVTGKGASSVETLTEAEAQPAGDRAGGTAPGTVLRAALSVTLVDCLFLEFSTSCFQPVVDRRC